jgi:hypothetical protein
MVDRLRWSGVIGVEIDGDALACWRRAQNLERFGTRWNKESQHEEHRHAWSGHGGVPLIHRRGAGTRGGG